MSKRKNYISKENVKKPQSRWIHRNFIIKNLISKKIIDDNTRLTYSCIHNNDLHFTSSPNIEAVDNDWCLVLDDNRVNMMYVFYFPKNSVNYDFPIKNMESGNTRIDLNIKQNFDGEFVNEGSKFVCNPYLVETVRYRNKNSIYC